MAACTTYSTLFTLHSHKHMSMNTEEGQVCLLKRKCFKPLTFNCVFVSLLCLKPSECNFQIHMQHLQSCTTEHSSACKKKGAGDNETI